jgi:hypothetical protein
MYEKDYIMNRALPARLMANSGPVRPIQLLFLFRPCPCFNAPVRPGVTPLEPYHAF